MGITRVDKLRMLRWAVNGMVTISGDTDPEGAAEGRAVKAGLKKWIAELEAQEVFTAEEDAALLNAKGE